MNCEARSWVEGESVEFVYHACERFRERFQPDLDHYHAVAQCRRLAEKHGHIRHTLPDGIHLGSSIRDGILTVAWLLVGDAVFPLCDKPGGGGYIATTCLAHRWRAAH